MRTTSDFALRKVPPGRVKVFSLGSTIAMKDSPNSRVYQLTSKRKAKRSDSVEPNTVSAVVSG